MVLGIYGLGVAQVWVRVWLHMVLGIYSLGVAQVPPLNTPHLWKYASCGNVRRVTPKRITEAAAPRPGGRDDWDC